MSIRNSSRHKQIAFFLIETIPTRRRFTAEHTSPNMGILGPQCLNLESFTLDLAPCAENLLYTYTTGSREPNILSTPLV